MKKRIRSALLVLTLELFIAFVCPQALLAGSSGSTTAEIGPGTVINQQNWRQYRNFMSEGLAALFQGDHFWHLPADLRIRVGPTISIPLPKKYLEDTSRYSNQVRLLKTAFGGWVPTGYVAGLPFPHPLETRTSDISRAFKRPPVLRTAWTGSAT